MRLLVLYYDGNDYKAKMKTDTQGISDSERVPSNADLDLDEDCSINFIVELSDDVSPTVFNDDGVEIAMEYV